MIRYTTGDATNPEGTGTKFICHICNDIGAWGRGFVLALSKKWKVTEKEYRKWYREDSFALGNMQLVKVESDTWVANMIAQRGIGWHNGKPPIRYESLTLCLLKLALAAQKMNATVHMPRIGCGLAGGKWELVEKIINETLVENGIEVFVYDLE